MKLSLLVDVVMKQVAVLAHDAGGSGCVVVRAEERAERPRVGIETG